MTEKQSYPNVGSILDLIGGILIILGGMLLTAVSAYILPYINYNVTTPPNMTPAGIPHLVSGVVGVMGMFGLVSGAIVLASAIMVRIQPEHRETWGILMLVFSLLSFIGIGGFVLGAILGVVGAILVLRWKQHQPTIPQPPQPDQVK